MNKHGLHFTHNDADAVGSAFVLSYFSDNHIFAFSMISGVIFFIIKVF